MEPSELSRFAGVLGHAHVTARKIDPGPALDWERLLREAAAVEAP
jgi:N-acetyl-anhydromuramyl-L-alanine amidase AmpD